MLTRDAILKGTGTGLRILEVPIPEWGGTVFLQEPTAAQMDAWQASLSGLRVDAEGTLTAFANPQNKQARLLVQCIVGPNGERIFQDSDAEALGKKAASVLRRLFDRLMDMAGSSGAAAKAIEGNSSAGGTDGSRSSSPATSE